MKEHEIRNVNGVYWTECPIAESTVPLTIEPKFCPMCGSAMPDGSEIVDHKYHGVIYKSETDEEVNAPWILFLAKDNAVPDMLQFYYNRCEAIGASREHLEGIEGLIDRVDIWRQRNPDKCKVPD